MTHSISRALVWFRRDLRAADNAALYHALRTAREVWCVFVFDTDILDPLPRRDRRVEFIHASLVDLDQLDLVVKIHPDRTETYAYLGPPVASIDHFDQLGTGHARHHAFGVEQQVKRLLGRARDVE